MERIAQINYWRLIRRRWSFITVVTLVVVLLSLIFTLVQPFRYQSEVKILVIQKSAIGIDAYSASKSAERIGRNLGQIIYSSDFFSKVLNAGFGVDRSFFPSDEDDRREEWQRMIATEVAAGTTILDVKVFHTDRDQATRIAQAVAFVLDQQAEEYIGVGDIDLRVVDAPLTSDLPVKPNFILNALLGLVLGIFIALAAVLFTYSESSEAEEVFGKSDKKAQRLARKAAKKARRQTKKKPEPTMIEDEKILATPSVEAALDVVEDEDITDFEEEPALPEPRLEPPKDEAPQSEYQDLPSFEDEDQIKTLGE